MKKHSEYNLNGFSFTQSPFIMFAIMLVLGATANAAPWQPGSEYKEIYLWPNGAPNVRQLKGPESELTKRSNLVAGRPWYQVANVARPTFTIYSPKINNTGAAVVVLPGGGYQVLAIDLEGTEVCDWLTSKGITCILLKYRVPDNGRLEERSGPYPKSKEALQDVQRALGLVRKQAAQWGIRPNKIGVLGFSAGGHLAAAISTNHQKRLYPLIDDADRESCRPDFAILIYPGHMAKNYDVRLGLNPNLPVSSDTPQTFLVHAKNDSVDPVEYSLLYKAALEKFKVPVEIHLFDKGGHAFGLRKTEFPITLWPQLVATWFTKIGMTSK